jgi:copper chaperone CopZ
MTCISCSSGVESALEGVPGVRNVCVSLLQQEARVEHDASVCPETLVQAVQDAGFGCRLLGPEGRANMSMLVRTLWGWGRYHQGHGDACFAASCQAADVDSISCARHGRTWTD